MDPNANLREQVDLAREIIRQHDQPDPHAVSEYDAARLAPLRRARGDGSFEIAETPAAILCPLSSTTSN